MSQGSHRQIARSSAVIGSASVVTVLIGIANAKLIALLLGPSGVALMGLFQNIQNAAATGIGLGLGSSGVRQVAASQSDVQQLEVVRRTLWLSATVSGTVGCVSLWLAREPVARWVFGVTEHANDVGWLAVGVLFTLLTSSRVALLKGLRRTTDLARVTIAGALIGAFAGGLMVTTLGARGVVFYVLAVPVAGFLIACYFTGQLPTASAPTPHWKAIRAQWSDLLRLGLPLMLATLLTLLSQLAARSFIVSELGIESAGYYQAAWVISMTYVAFVLGAMATDYYPRLTASIADRDTTQGLVAEQTEMALLMAGPVLLCIMTTAPLAIFLLYTPSFAPAANVLQWQILGDILKVASWPMSFILLAQGRGWLHIASEITWNLVYLLVISSALRHWGIVTAGVAYFACYLLYFALMSFLSYRLVGFRQTSRNALGTAALVVGAAIILALQGHAWRGVHPVGVPLTLLAIYYASRRLNQLIDLSSIAARLLRR